MTRFLFLKMAICMLIGNFLPFHQAVAQINSQSATFSLFGNQVINIQVNGFLDDKISLKRHRYWCIGLPEFTYVPNFTTLDSLVIYNKDSVQIQQLMVLTNNQNNYYRFDSISKYAISPYASNDIDSIWDVYQFVGDRHYYYYKPENCVREPYEITKHFGSYGYGNCGTIGNCANVIGHKVSGKGQRWWGINGGAHIFSELKFNQKWRFVDADEYEIFLDVDNKTPISLGDLYEDPYLGFRTKILGPNLAYSYAGSKDFVNRLYFSTNHYTWNTDSANYIGIVFAGGKDSLIKSDLGFNIYPAEKLIFSTNDEYPFYHHLISTPCTNPTTVGNYPDSSNLFPMIKNARINLNLMDTNLPFNKKVSSANNLSIASSDQSILSNGGTGNFILSRKSSLPMVNGFIHLNYTCLTPTDQIQIQISQDSLNWITIFSSAPAISKDTLISIYNFINPKIKNACYDLFVQTVMNSTNGNQYCIIKQFDFNYTLQLSKYLFPSLLVGQNQIKLQSETTPNYQADVMIKWKENFTNHAPLPPQYAIYPNSGDTVQNTNITFKWQQIWKDQDNDSIKEWHFLLSEYPDFRHPLANNFNQYSGGITNFNIADSWNLYNTLKVYPNFYNHLNTYYWKVRIMDKKGAWSEWSPIWQFTVKCPMHPINVHFEKTSSDTTYNLVWTNQTQGLPINKFFVYGSQSNKLPIEQIYFRDSVNQSGYPMSMNSVKSVRLLGKDNLGNPSTPSRLAYMPFKDSTIYGDTLDFSAQINSLQKPFPSYPGLERNYFLLFDTTYFKQLSTYQVIPKKIGQSLINICYTKEDLIDTIYRQQIDYTIFKANLIVKANDTNFVYGDQPVLSGVSYVGFKLDDSELSLSTTPSISTTATQTSPVGNYPILVNGAASDNYHINYINGNCEVKQAPLYITAVDTNAHYGDASSLNGLIYMGFKNGENQSVLQNLPSLSCIINPLTPVGNYPILVDSAQGINYSMNYTAGIFTVLPAVLSIQAKDTTAEYGTIPSTNGVIYNGFKNGEDQSVLTNLPIVTTPATNTSSVGIYPLIVNNALATNYSINYLQGQLSIYKAALSIVAKDTFMNYGNQPNLNGLKVLGLKGTDNTSILSTMPLVTSSVNQQSNVGQYPISFIDTSITANNYTIQFTTGTFEVRKRALSYIIESKEKFFAQLTSSLSYQWSGFVNGDTEAVIDTLPQLVCEVQDSSLSGNYPITANLYGDNNYQLNVTPNVFVVYPIKPANSLRIDSISEQTIFVSHLVQSTGGQLQSAGIQWYTQPPANSLIQDYPLANLNDYSQKINFTYQDKIPLIQDKIIAIYGYIRNSAGSSITDTLYVNSFSSSIRISPNPSQGQFSIFIEDYYVGSHLSVFDAAGKRVHEQKLHNLTNQISLNLAPGIYLLKISKEGEKNYESKIRIQ